jgi:hypothetical protein
MDRQEALATLISARHYCFKRAFGRPPEDDFRAAFRILNRFYVQLRDNKAFIVPPKRSKGTQESLK